MNRRRKKSSLSVLVVVLLLIIVLIGCGIRLLDSAVFSDNRENGLQEESEKKTITVNGVDYYPRQDITVILAMGIDTEGEMADSGSYNNNGEVDVISLIIFDEVQDCPKVINSMKYFCENAPQYHVACAGSLLGIALAKPSSFPVGKVNFMQIDPMTFAEFLLANGDENLAQYLEQVDTLEPIPDAFFNPLYEKLKMYYVTGGMPESVLMWTEARDVAAMQEALSNIIGAYERDFAKHPNISEFPKISMIWKSIPSQLARENKKFIYKVVKEGARAREYEDALQWLVDARLVHKIYRSSAPGLPVAAYDDLSAFKIYLVDVGLLRRLAQLAPTAFGEGNRLFTEFKGALTENFVLQSLTTQFEVVPRYWTQTNPPYEVDFLIQRENDVFPVEVKSDTNTTSKSLKKFKELFPDKVKLRVRFSLDNLKLDDDVLNIPLFMADEANRLIGLALEQKKN